MDEVRVVHRSESSSLVWRQVKWSLTASCLCNLIDFMNNYLTRRNYMKSLNCKIQCWASDSTPKYTKPTVHICDFLNGTIIANLNNTIMNMCDINVANVYL